jgi:DNA polymerase-3 subunit gamma/tau
LLDQASLDEVIETLAALRGAAPLPPGSAPPQNKPSPVRAEEEPGPALAKPAEAGSIDAAVAWNRVASSYESSIKFRWLTKAIFAEANPDGVLVQVPPSFAGELRSVVGEAGRKNAEAKLSEALGKKVDLRLEVGEHLAGSHSTETSGQPAPSGVEPQTSGLHEEKSKDPAEEFKNDPLIKKALEIFAGEIQTAAK